jgi:hypothetical protein
MFSAEDPSSTQEPQGKLFRPTLNRTETPVRLTDGRSATIQTIEGNGPNAKPVSVALVYIEKKAVALFQYSYKRKNQEWVPSRVRTILFDKTGRGRSVFDQDVGELDLERGQHVGMTHKLQDGFFSFGSRLLALAAPDAAYAASVDTYSSECSDKREAMYLAIAAAAIAGAIAAAEIEACPETIITCVPAVKAIAASTLAGAAAVRAIRAYWQCKSDHPCNVDIVAGGGSGGRGIQPRLTCYLDEPLDQTYGTSVPTSGGSGCAWYTMQISYDGGETWENYGAPFQLCDFDPNEMT